MTSAEDLFSVSGKNVLISGGGRGIGLMIAEGFVRGGATVYISSRKKEALDKAATKLSVLPGSGSCIAVAGDVSSNAGCKRLAAAVESLSGGRLHVLVNNSGTSWGQPFEEYAEKGWGKVMALNVVAPFQLTRAVLPLLEAASTARDPARVINIGSISGLQHQPFPTYAYDTSKAAVHALTRKLAAELARRSTNNSSSGKSSADGSNQSHRPITVNAVAPGYVPTTMSRQLSTYAGADEVQGTIPLGRWGEADDMAGACIFLASKAGAWITGAVLPVDGGQLTTALQVGRAKL